MPSKCGILVSSYVSVISPGFLNYLMFCPTVLAKGGVPFKAYTSCHFNPLKNTCYFIWGALSLYWGSFCRRLLINCFRLFDISAGYFTSFSTIYLSILDTLRSRSVNGGRPTAISYIRIPRDHQSTYLVCPIYINILILYKY